jgi:anti-anti-sigma factor
MGFTVEIRNRAAIRATRQQYVPRVSQMSSSEYFSVERTNDVLVVVLGRRLDSFAGPELLTERAALLDEIRNPGIAAVLVDFDHVEYFDSMLLDTLCQTWRHLRERKATMALCNLRDVSEEIIRKCRLDSLWPVYPSRQSAIEVLRPKGA